MFSAATQISNGRAAAIARFWVEQAVLLMSLLRLCVMAYSADLNLEVAVCLWLVKHSLARKGPLPQLCTAISYARSEVSKNMMKGTGDVKNGL